MAPSGGLRSFADGVSSTGVVQCREILGVLRKAPFQPFKFVMIGGRKFPVPHEDHAQVTKNGTIIHSDTGERPWPMLNANLVARIEFLEQTAA